MVVIINELDFVAKRIIVNEFSGQPDYFLMPCEQERQAYF